MLNEKFLQKFTKDRIPSLSFNDIHWKVQDSHNESLLFYKILPDETSLKNFSERIKNASYSWLIVNTDHPERPRNSSVISEDQWPVIQKEILDFLYPLPLIQLFAVTGTNGKTTTADLVLQLGELSGKKGMSVGTLGVREKNRTILDFGMTSPNLIDLRKFLNKYGIDKDFCVLEASSHALTQKRLYGLEFDVAGWLSFSQDHLDYHKTMEEYFSSKMMLFNHLREWGIVFVPDNQEELFSKISSFTDKVRKAPKIEGKLPLFFMTSFNRNNLEVAKEIVEKGFHIAVDSEVFEKLIPPDGRFYIKPYNSNFIVVDFAHTPDALDNICKGIRESFPSHTLKVLFGCGGDRDRSKRPLMGKIAEAHASEIYVTSDNPRSEKPEQIIEDIMQGISKAKLVHRITERPLAVQAAFRALGENEILLLAGKGNEDYILINGVKHPYCDIAEVEKFLSRK